MHKVYIFAPKFFYETPYCHLVCFPTSNTQKIAERIARQLSENDDVDIIDVKKEKNISLAAYDALVLGTSVYAEQPVAYFKKVIMPSDDILSKPLFLFVCGMEPQESKQAVEINNAFPGYIFDKAKGTYFVGGEFDFK